MLGCQGACPHVGECGSRKFYSTLSQHLGGHPLLPVVAELLFLTIPEAYDYIAMCCIVRMLDAKIPYTRVLGVCHLLLGPVLLWLVASESIKQYPTGSPGLCIFLDFRDLILCTC